MVDGLHTERELEVEGEEDDKHPFNDSLKDSIPIQTIPNKFKGDRYVYLYTYSYVQMFTFILS
jgi:hypothetical protein